MTMYKLFIDKPTDFECKIELEGASLKESQARLILESSNEKFLYEGTISQGGQCKIHLPKMRDKFDEGYRGKMKLEIIAEDTYFQPWSSDFSVSASKKVVVEMVDQEEAISKPRAKVIVENKEQDKINEVALRIIKPLQKRGYGRESLQNKKTKKIVMEYIKRTVNEIHENVDKRELIDEVVHRLSK